MTFPLLSVIPKSRFALAAPHIPSEVAVEHWEDWSDVRRGSPTGFRAVLGVGLPIPGAVLRAPDMELLQLVSASYERVDMAIVREMGLTLCNNPGRNADAVADHIVMSLLYFARRMGECQNVVLGDNYHHNREGIIGPLLRDLEEMTVGLVGFGAIGRSVADRLHPFGPTLLYHNRTRRREDEARFGVRYAEFDELLRTADAVVAMLPLTAETKGLFGREAFARMKPETIFVNVGRGALVDQRALVEALLEHRVYAASLDVFDPEPVTKENPVVLAAPQLRDRLLLSPHIAGVTHRTWRVMVQKAIDNVAAYARGEEPHHVVVRGRGRGLAAVGT